MRRKEKEIIKKTYFIIFDETCGTTRIGIILGGHFENGPERKKRGGKKKERKKKKKKTKKKNKKEEENKKENTPRDFFYLPNPYLFFPHFFTHKNTYFFSNFVFYYHPKNKLAKILEVLPRHLLFLFFCFVFVLFLFCFCFVLFCFCFVFVLFCFCFVFVLFLFCFCKRFTLVCFWMVYIQRHFHVGISKKKKREKKFLYFCEGGSL